MSDESEKKWPIFKIPMAVGDAGTVYVNGLPHIGTVTELLGDGRFRYDVEDCGNDDCPWCFDAPVDPAVLCEHSPGAIIAMSDESRDREMEERLRLLESALACGCLAFCEPCPECEAVREAVDRE